MMARIRFVFVALLALFVLGACAPAAPSATPTAAGPRLRVINQGQVEIKDLVVLFPESEIAFGNLAAGATSDYRPAPNGVYNYAAYRYTLNGQEVTQPVIDWVGENPRAGQSFTYVIDFDPARQQMLAVQLVEVREP